MPDKNLSDNMVKLVEYAIVSIQRNQERIIYCGTRVVTDNMSGEGFAAWVIAEYLQKPGHKEILNSAKKYLRVYYKVLDRWPRESLHFEEKQLATLRQIRDAIPVKGVEPPTSGEAERVKPEREKRTTEGLPKLEDTAEKPESEGNTPDDDVEKEESAEDTIEGTTEEEHEAVERETTEPTRPESEEPPEAGEIAEPGDQETPDIEDQAESPESEAGGLSALAKKIMEVLKAAKRFLWARELADTIDESRDAVRKILRDLEASGHVERRGSRYGRLES